MSTRGVEDEDVESKLSGIRPTAANVEDSTWRRRISWQTVLQFLPRAIELCAVLCAMNVMLSIAVGSLEGFSGTTNCA
jgi:hypothetical protein